MNKISAILLVFIINFSSALSFHIDNASTNVHKTLDKQSFSKNRINAAENFFAQSKSPFDSEFVATNPYYLMQAAQDALYYLNSRKSSDESIVPSHFKNMLPRENIESTLKFIISTIKQDLPSGKFRILDPNFLNKNFKFIKWTADIKTASSNGIKLGLGGPIRLTSYAVFNVNGSYKKTSTNPCALYQALDNKICKLYTKHQVLKGILDAPQTKKHTQPLAWLSRDDFEDALMQGTIIVKMPDLQEHIYIANECNGIEYNKKATDAKQQERFWYFREIKNSKWSLEQFKKRLNMRQNVIFAGDLYNLGLGKIIAIKHTNPVTRKQEIRLGVVADTGGAFIKNLYQLDLFAGIFNSRSELSAYLKHLPVQTDAYILHR